MKKAVKGTLIALPVVLALVLIVAYFKIGDLLKTAVETVGPEVLQAPVRVEGVSVRPLRGMASLAGLEIGNPEGFRTPSSIKLGRLRVDVDMGTIRTDTVHIRSIHIDAPEVTIEGLRADNIRQLKRNAMAYAGGGEATPPPEPGAERRPVESDGDKTPGKKVIIDEIVLSGGKIYYTPGLTLGQTLTVELPEIRLEHIGEAQGGVSLVRALIMVFEDLETRVLGSTDTLDDLASQGLRGLSGKAAEATGLSTNEVEAGMNEALRQVRGLLGEKEE